MHHKRLQCEFQHQLSIAYIIKNFILHSNEKKVFYSFNAIFVKLNSNNTLHTQHIIYTTKIYVVVGRYQSHSIARFWIWYSFLWNKSNVCIYAFCVLRFNRLLVFFILKYKQFFFSSRFVAFLPSSFYTDFLYLWYKNW